VTIRRSGPGDLEDINRIYNQAVLKTTATFDTEPKTLRDREAWFGEHGPAHPVIVAEEAAEVRGWASLSPYSDRAAYARTVEISLYVSEESRGKGIGTSLMRAIVDEARTLGHHVILARIAQGNPVSIRIHESAGFFMVGTMKEVGVKFGQILDVHLMELILPA
jgi:L-amino acid N-acyltransferase YncA